MDSVFLLDCLLNQNKGFLAVFSIRFDYFDGDDALYGIGYLVFIAGSFVDCPLLDLSQFLHVKTGWITGTWHKVHSTKLKVKDTVSHQ